MARYPGARWRPVTRYLQGGSSAQPMSRYDGGIDHTYVGSPSSDAAFTHFNVSGTPTPHFMVFRDGTVDQYIDTRFRSSACLDGNPRLVTWETADGFPGLWTDGQAPKDTPVMVQAKAELMVWLHKEHGIPLVQMPSSKSTARGMGWHRLGIDGNFEQRPGQLLGGRVAGGEHWSTSTGKTCPTSRRIHQFVEETLPAAVELAKPPVQLTLIGWNCYVANSEANVRDTLTGWIKEHKPEAFCLSECRPHARTLARIPGYTTYQETPGADDGKVVNEQGDSVILVRNDLAPHVHRDHVAAMLIKWVVVGHDRTHQPRRYQVVNLRHSGRRWRIRASHFPTHGFKGANRSAFLESATRSKAWAMLNRRGAVSLDVGDLNESMAAMADFYGKGFTLAGQGIDMLVGRNVASVDHTRLEKGGSDHHGHLYVVRAAS